MRDGKFELVLTLAVLLVMLATGFMLGEFWIGFLARCVTWMLLAVSFTIAYAYANVPSVAQATLYGVGAYTTLWLAELSGGNLLLLLLASCIAGFLVALLLGALVLKMSRNGAAIATIIVAVMGVLLGNASTALTGGADGLALPGVQFHIFGRPVDAGPNATMLVLGTIILAALLLGVWFISQTHTWRVVRAVQQNAMRAQVLGYAAGPYRLVVFGASGAVAGIGGSLYAIVSEHVTTDTVSMFMSLKAIMWAAVGGISTVFGGPLGVLLVQIASEVLSRWTFRNDFFVGVLLVLIALWLPNGLMGLLSGKVSFRRGDNDTSKQGQAATSVSQPLTRTSEDAP
ncbi:MAG: branched-chain amino acid ABC transporter permease [Parvibaculaceae bacterium]